MVVKLIFGMVIPWTPLLPALIAIKLEEIEKLRKAALGAAQSTRVWRQAARTSLLTPNGRFPPIPVMAESDPKLPLA